MLGAKTHGIALASSRSPASCSAENPVVPMTMAFLEAAMIARCMSVASGEVNSTRTWARSASAARLSVTATPRRPHPAVSPASAPTAGCPFCSTAPTSWRFGVSLIRLTSRVPMRPPAPVTITLTTSLPYRFFQNSIERVAPHGTLAERKASTAESAGPRRRKRPEHVRIMRRQDPRQFGVPRNDPFRAPRQHRQGQRIITGEDREAVAAELDDLAHLLERPRPFLDAHDVSDLGQPRHRLRGHIHAGATRDVVKDLRELHRLSHGLVMAVEALLGRLVVVRRDQEGRVRADGLGMACALDRLVRRVGPPAGNDRHAMPDGLHGELDDPLVLFMGERGGLARRPTRHDPVGSVRELPLEQVGEGFLVYFALAKRGDDGDQRSGEAHRSLYSQALECMEPSYTARASPVRVMSVNLFPSTRNDTARGLRLKGRTVTGDSTL